jgi:hypothetical protein
MIVNFEGQQHNFPDDATEEEIRSALGQQPMSWGEVGLQAASNVGPSARRFVHDIAQPILHPVQTAEQFADLGEGAMQAGGLWSGSDKTPYARAVKDFMVQRYGGLENLKHTMASDPVGFLGDLSVIFSGGETALARAPGVAGRIGEIVGEVGRTVNPITMPLQATKLASVPVGAMTRTGGESLRALGKAGFEGGLPFNPNERAQAAAGALSGAESQEEIVNAARQGVDAMRDARRDAYQTDMATMTNPAVLPFNKIGEAIREAGMVKSYKGVSYGAPKVDAVRDQLQAEVAGWAALPPQEFHTVEGLDKFKQKIGEIRDTTQPGTPERVLANKVYGAIRQTIIDADPKYAKIMKAYEIASNEIRNIERELSLNPNANVGTSLRKLQSVLRNNVSTAYGYRRELLDFLTKAGAPHLMERLAGAANRPWMARGLGALGQHLAMEAGALLLGAGAATGTGLATATGGMALAAAPFMSPRLMGEVAYRGGRALSPLKLLPKQTAAALPTAARLERPLQVTVPRRSEPEQRADQATATAFVSRTLAPLLGQRAEQLPQLIAADPRLRGPVDDWARAVGAYNAKWSPGAVSKVILATRNLMSNLREAGIDLAFDDILTAAGIRRIEDHNNKERNKAE